MRQILSNHDLKTLFQGVAGVACAGLLLGAVAHPNLDEHEVAGPQIQMPGGGARGDGPAADPGVGAYPGQTPDYVIGTDWTRPPPVQYAQSAPGDTEVTVLAADDDSPATVSQASWRDEPREPTRYPSQSGNAYYEANLPGPPAPPADDDTGADAG